MPTLGSSRDVIAQYGGRFGQRILLAGALYQTCRPLYDVLRQRFAREAYTVVLNGGDSLYSPVHAWVLDQMPRDTQKGLILETSHRKPWMHPRFDGSRTHEIKIEGHRVRVSVIREAMGNMRNDQMPEHWAKLMERVVFSASSLEGQAAVLRTIEGLATKYYGDEELPPLLIPAYWGTDWQERTDVKPRSLESVILKEGQKERLVLDLQRFLESEEDYMRLGQPWHRGYLFHGAPGTGKTSIAQALANHFDLPVFYLPLGDQKNDAKLLQLIAELKPRSVLLIEDVDVYQAARERSDEEGKSSLSAVLNALDGIWTPHGLITIMTSNAKDSLDTALLRAGRISVAEEFSVLDEAQAERLASYLTFDGDPEGYVGKSPADMIEAAHQALIGETYLERV